MADWYFSLRGCEFLNFTSKKRAIFFEEYLKKGVFPEYLKFSRSVILQKLFNDIIMRDIVVHYKLRSPKVIKELALYLISNIGVES